MLGPMCACGLPAARRKVSKPGRTRPIGTVFYNCSRSLSDPARKCELFLWEEEWEEQRQAEQAAPTLVQRMNGKSWLSAIAPPVAPVAGPAMVAPPAQSLPVAPASALATAAATPLPKLSTAPATPPPRGAAPLVEARAGARPVAGLAEPDTVDDTAELAALLKQLSVAAGRLAELLAKRV